MDTLVLIPGLGSDFGVWQRTIDALGPGVACQVGDTLQDDTVAGMARRVLAAAPATFSLAGLSMGGMVALEIMRLEPDRVLRLALVDTNARADTEEQRARRLEVNAFVLQAAEQMVVLAELSLPSLVHDDNAAFVRQSIIEMSVRVGAATYVRQNLAALSRDDMRPVLADIAIPTSVVVARTIR